MKENECERYCGHRIIKAKVHWASNVIFRARTFNLFDAFHNFKHRFEVDSITIYSLESRSDRNPLGVPFLVAHVQHPEKPHPLLVAPSLFKGPIIVIPKEKTCHQKQKQLSRCRTEASLPLWRSDRWQLHPQVADFMQSNETVMIVCIEQHRSLDHISHCNSNLWISVHHNHHLTSNRDTYQVHQLQVPLGAHHQHGVNKNHQKEEQKPHWYQNLKTTEPFSTLPM